MLLVATTRPDFRPSWVTRPQVTVQTLGGLHPHQAHSIVIQVSGDQSLPGDVVERIIAHADGIPLFIEELTKTVLERHQQRIQSGDQGPAEPLSAEMVPTS